MQLNGLRIWRRALGFHLAYWTSLLPLMPFLCFPVLGDALSSLLIQQTFRGTEMLPWQAFRNACRLLPRLFAMKLYFEVTGFLWALVPIYGILPGIKHRLYWAMASNVLAFEGLSGEVGQNRCRKLIENFSQGTAVRTLITVPSLLHAGFVILWVVMGNVFAVVYVYGFWALLFLVCWILLPGSGAVNTFLYLEFVEQEKTRSAN